MKLNSLLRFGSRSLISTVFVGAGYDKFKRPDGNLDYMAQHGLPRSRVLLYSAALLEVGGGIALGLGLLKRPVALVLASFLAPVTAIFHRDEGVHVAKNLSIIGGLLEVAIADDDSKLVQSVMSRDGDGEYLVTDVTIRDGWIEYVGDDDPREALRSA